MGDDRIKQLKDRFIGIVEGQINGDISQVDAEELGYVMDMAKDCAEMMKYCAEQEYYQDVTKAMKEGTEESRSKYMQKYLPESKGKYYSDNPYITNDMRGWDDMRDMDRVSGRMYYTAPISHNGNNTYQRDYREGRSPMTRRMYMEMKENGADKNAKMRELEQYMVELGEDLAEMVNGLTPEEKNTAKQRISGLAAKIV